MHVVTRRHLLKASLLYPDAAKEIASWYKIVKAARWQSFVEVRRTFADADLVEGHTVFNLRHNAYRMITVIHFARVKHDTTTEGHVYIRSVLTHKQYDNPANWHKGVKR